MNRISKLVLTLENCDQIEIDGKYIGNFCVKDIRMDVSRVAMNAVVENQVCHYFFCEIHKDANKEEHDVNFGSRRPFDRLVRWQDITQIDFTLVTDDVWLGAEEATDANSKKYHFLLEWEDRGDVYCENNPRQKSYVSEQGWFYIEVSDRSTEEFREWLTDDVDGQDYCDFTSEMYDIGDACFQEYVDLYEGIAGGEEE